MVRVLKLSIVRKGDIIGEAAARTIAQMRGERQFRLLLPPLGGTLVLLCLSRRWSGLGCGDGQIKKHQILPIPSTAAGVLLKE
jgi:hypothetical protein